jgi:hypothetical protein
MTDEHENENGTRARGPADEEAEQPAQAEPEADGLRDDTAGPGDASAEETTDGTGRAASAEETADEAGQESNPGRIMSYEEAREVREEPDAVEGVPAGAGGPAEERGDRLPPDQVEADPARVERLTEAESPDDRAQIGFDTDREAVTEPDQPVAEAEGAEDTEGIPESVTQTHEAEGLTTLDEVAADEGLQGSRFEKLMQKRKTVGLTDAEAGELGKLVAEQEGESYWSAQTAREGGDREPAAEEASPS